MISTTYYLSYTRLREMQYTIAYERSLLLSVEPIVELLRRCERAAKAGNEKAFVVYDSRIDDHVRVYTPYIPSVEWTPANTLNTKLRNATDVNTIRLFHRVRCLLDTKGLELETHKLRKDLCIIRAAMFMKHVSEADWMCKVNDIHIKLRNKQVRLDAIREFAPQLCGVLDRVKYAITSGGNIRATVQQEKVYMEEIRQAMNTMILKESKGMEKWQIDVLTRGGVWMSYETYTNQGKITQAPPGFARSTQEMQNTMSMLGRLNI